ncbi:trans-sulfuration enzyme family protein [Kibdelosporangium phytohabitans]|uniref:homocysteine desulfhydrase n=1 Tax=Kibdelosporangium phytohabitans TaxID=860235 RepID=A0A0N9HZP8_9PSEU|nr:aminotransferase class I/II-fold pyridoxal phosphate-dependent enzyme [Kibdelosporangium phytohabitans]ALG11246.1 cystathionine gamma-synthase [Kibdelosporangium phytohabitans]MBE1462529.1 methionine-gamma-lyase [Kibdelosporangium phytohabitans]
MHRETRAAKITAPDPGHPVSVPLYQTANFRFDGLDEVAAAAGSPESFGYTGYTNPTTRALEDAMADLEGGTNALVTSSGSSAVSAVLQTTLRHGDHIIAQKALYGGTVAAFNHLIDSWGVEVTYIDGVDPMEVAEALRPTTKLLYLETIGNPIGHVPDLPGLAAEAKRHGVLTAVDSTFATPLLCRPIEHGADIVIHSASKYLGGHHDVIAGVAVFAGEALYADAWKRAANLGVIVEPFTAWLLIRSLKTLALRVDRQCSTATTLAARLAGHPAVTAVHHPGLPTHPSHARATKLLSDYGATFAVEVTDARKFMGSLKLVMNTLSLGGTDTTVMHPATTSHRHLSADEQRTAGVNGNMVRIAVGVEHPDDLWTDIQQALDSL